MGVQVQTATKDGQGNPLSILNRQFISFSYGYKKNENGEDIPVRIEDFDLLVSFSNDRLDKEIYATFKDTTTNQTELDGQMFWRSTFEAGKLNFVLVTDGMTSAQLEDFKMWFQPGFERELILSEFHNRGIKARVAAAPQMSLLPFEKEVEITLGETEEREIGQDEEGNPIKENFLIYYPTKTSLYKGEIQLEFVMDDPYWYSLVEMVETVDKESLKLCHEDGIPYLQMFNGKEVYLGNNKYYDGSKIVKDFSGLTIDSEDTKYLYYCGTASSKPKLSFKIKPTLVDNYYTFPGLDKNTLATLTIGENSFLKFTLPSLLTSFNNAVDIVKKYSEGDSVLELRRELRDKLYNNYTRSYAIGIVDKARANTSYCKEGVILSTFQDFFFTEFKKFLSSGSALTVTINCKTGEVLTEAKPINSSETITENTGNMIKSNYLTIDTRTLPVNGKINVTQCLAIKTNTKLDNLIIDYKYYYL